MSYGKIYETTDWGNPVQNGWGGIYYDLSVTSEIPALLTALQARATYYENATGTTTILTALENCEQMSNLLSKASIVLTPTAYSDGDLHCIKPNTATGDFDFSRSTTATRENSNGNIESVASNLPRIDYSGGTAHILLEPQSTNYSGNSEQPSTWHSSGGVTVTANATTSPEGTTNASLVVVNTSNALVYARNSFSFYIKLCFR